MHCTIYRRFAKLYWRMKLVTAASKLTINFCACFLWIVPTHCHPLDWQCKCKHDRCDYHPSHFWIPSGDIAVCGAMLRLVTVAEAHRKHVPQTNPICTVLLFLPWFNNGDMFGKKKKKKKREGDQTRPDQTCGTRPTSLTVEVGSRGFLHCNSFNSLYELAPCRRQEQEALEADIIKICAQESYRIWCKRNWKEAETPNGTTH